jgi:transketolase
MTMRQRFVDVMTRALDEDPQVALVLADISVRLLGEALHRHPGRVLNVGIREQLLVGATAGLALSGLRPVAHTYAPFLVERAFEQVKLDLGHQDLGAVLVSAGASYDEPGYGRTHQAPGDIALLDTVPGFAMHVPGHPDEVEVLLRHELAQHGRAYLRTSVQENARPHPVRPGRFLRLRDGTQATVVAVGPVLDRALAATEGLDVTVLYAATVRPFDAEALLAGPCQRVVLVEPYLTGTSAWLVSAALSHLPHRMLSLGVGRQELRRYGSPVDHDRAHGLDTPGLRSSIAAWLAVQDRAGTTDQGGTPQCRAVCLRDEQRLATEPLA